ncbi:MAG: hypothetical protein ABSH03_17775 [Candidatus Lustribacter sp.]|jgi:hypothetical protein
MTLLAPVLGVLFALRFSLDDYTNWYNSPGAAVYFWSFFFAVVLVIVVVTLWVFRKMRPH